jgi:choice-of-anchor B domain-containing protein
MRTKSSRLTIFKGISIIILALGFSINSTSQTINFISKLSYTTIPVHDVWGYTDTVTGTPYALLCASNSGMKIIDISDVYAPVEVGAISGGGVEPIDVKTWKNYAYVVAESTTLTGKIIDLTDPTSPNVVGTFPGGHNITISDSGYMYLSAPGLRIFDLNPDPTVPVLEFTDNSCLGHDMSIVGNRLYDFSDNCGTRIFDISIPNAPSLLGTVSEPSAFHHSGWPSADGNYVFVCDELATPIQNDISVWDISNVSSPVKVDSFLDATSYVHNLYVVNDYAYVSYYRAGFRVFDIQDPTQISMVAEYDTDSSASGPGYGGNFGLYINTDNGLILASDEGNGLYLFSFSGLAGIEENASIVEHPLIAYPNPSSDKIQLDIYSENNQIIQLQLFSIESKLIKKFDETPIKKGVNTVNLDISTVPAGTYILEVWENYSVRIVKE